MAQVINTNVASLFAGAALNKSAINLQTAQARLSSGLRINTSKDDATGLVTATGLDSSVRGTNVAIAAANTAVTKSQTADGYGAQIIENLQRMYEIAVQLGGTATGAETTALLAENSRIAGLTSAQLAGTVVVDGAGTTASGVGAAVAVPTGVTAANILLDITAVTGSRANYGADMVRFSSAVASMQVAAVNFAASYSRIMDTDYAAETTAMTRNNILQQAGTAVLAQANQTPNTVLSLLR
jgi:flagellin